MSFKLTAFYTPRGCTAPLQAGKSMNRALSRNAAFAINARGLRREPEPSMLTFSGQKDRDRPYTKIRLALALAQVFDSGDAAHLMAFSIRRWKCGLDQALLS